MASISPIKNKDGKIYAYRIRVFHYQDSDGKKHFHSMNWTIPPTYKSAKAIDSALQRAIGEFESRCSRGEVSAENRTLSEYCRYYIETKSGLKPASKQFYYDLLPYIDDSIGCIKIKNITPETIDSYYKSLQTTEKRTVKMIAKERTLELLKAENIRCFEQAKLIGISENAFRALRQQKNISTDTAKKASEYLNKPITSLFEASNSGEMLSNSTIRHIHSLLHATFQFAVKKRAIVYNVVDNAEPPKTDVKESEFFEPREILQIKKNLEKEPLKYVVMINLLIALGIRRGELFALRWSSFDFESATVTIDKNVQFISKQFIIGTPKNGKSRSISFAKELIPLLKQYKEEQERSVRIKFSYIENSIERHKAIKGFNPEKYLFTQENGTVMNPTTLNRWLNKFSEKVGFHINPHAFRHSQASILIASGIDVVTVSKRLGHSQVSTTQNIYSHLLEGSDKEASNTISSLLFKTS